MTSIIISIISCVVAVASAVFALVKFVSYDKKLTSLDTAIKEYQLKNIKDEEELSKRAFVEANAYYHKQDLTIVKFYNKGKAIARNINFETLDDIRLQAPYAEQLLPYSVLNPQESFELKIRTWSNKVVCQIKITWEDDCGKQERIQALQLC